MTKVDVWKNNVLIERDMTTSEQSEWDSHNTTDAITQKKLSWIKDIRLEKLQEILPKYWQGWNGDNFNHNYNFMTPEDMAMEEGDELDWNYVGAPCHY